MARYKQLTCPEQLHLTAQEGECHVRFEWLLAENDEPALLIDLCFAWVVDAEEGDRRSAPGAANRGARAWREHSHVAAPLDR